MLAVFVQLPARLRFFKKLLPGFLIYFRPTDDFIERTKATETNIVFI
jgi:hypothetical protein